MRLRQRHGDQTTDERTDDRSDIGRRDVGDRGDIGRRDVNDRDAVRSERAGDDVVARDEVIETTSPHWDLGSVLATAAGVALTVIGVLALVRTGVDETWYSPVEEVASVSHTPLLGAIEVGVGVLLILAGLTGARMVAALVALVAGIGAAVVAIEPELVDQELALERGWAAALAVALLALALVLVMARERRQERRIEHRTMRHA